MKTIITDLKKTLLFSLLTTSVSVHILSYLYQIITTGFDKEGWLLMLIIFTLGYNFIYAFISCIITILITKKITNENFQISLIKVLIFALIYGVIKYSHLAFIVQTENNKGNIIQHSISGLTDGLFYALFILQFSKFRFVNKVDSNIKN